MLWHASSSKACLLCQLQAVILSTDLLLISLIKLTLTENDTYSNLSSREEVYDLFSRNSGDSDYILEARGKKYVPPAPEPITFRKGGPHDAGNHLDKLSLYSNKRKATEDFHKKVVSEHMKSVPGAHTAEIV